jgi:hypothetical protein
MFVMCLARRWDSHLMWAHYASAHRGFAAAYDDGLTDMLSVDADFVGNGDVTYLEEPRATRWFQ